MRLNLGCGNHKLQGWINVDKSPACQPDEVVDLEACPWPWADGAAEEILLNHVLEHLGATPERYIAVMKELWRVCRDGARITVVVPHPRHDDFLGDPTHVRVVTGPGLQLFDRKLNEKWLRAGASNTPLAVYHGIDFEIVEATMHLDEPWMSALEQGKITQAAVAEAAQRLNNVVKEQRFVLKAIKECR